MKQFPLSSSKSIPIDEHSNPNSSKPATSDSNDNRLKRLSSFIKRSVRSGSGSFSSKSSPKQTTTSSSYTSPPPHSPLLEPHTANATSNHPHIAPPPLLEAQPAHHTMRSHSISSSLSSVAAFRPEEHLDLQKSIEVASRLLFDSNEDLTKLSHTLPNIPTSTSSTLQSQSLFEALPSAPQSTGPTFPSSRQSPQTRSPEISPRRSQQKRQQQIATSFVQELPLVDLSLNDSDGHLSARPPPCIDVNNEHNNSGNLTSDQSPFNNCHYTSRDISPLGSTHRRSPLRSASESRSGLPSSLSIQKSIPPVWTSQTFAKLNDSKGLFGSPLSHRLDTARSVFTEESSVTCLNFETEDQWATLHQHVRLATERLETAESPTILSGNCAKVEFYRMSHDDLSNGSVTPRADGDQTGRLNTEEILPTVSPKGRKEWETYNTERSASSYVFVRLLDGIALELHRRIYEKSEELNSIESHLHQHVSASANYTKTMKSHLQQQMPTTGSVAVSHRRSSSSASSAQHHDRHRQPPKHPPTATTPNTTTSSASAASSIQCTPTNETTRDNRTYNNHGNTPATTKTPGGQSPYTPAPIGADLSARSPPKGGKQKAPKKRHETEEEKKTIGEQQEGGQTEQTAAASATVAATEEAVGSSRQRGGNGFIRAFSRQLSIQSRKSENQSTVYVSRKRSSLSAKNYNAVEYNQHKTGAVANQPITPLQAFIQCMRVETNTLEHETSISEAEILPALQALSVQYSSAGRLSLDVLGNGSTRLKNELSSTSKLWKEFRTGLVEMEVTNQNNNNGTLNPSSGMTTLTNDPWLLEKNYINGVYRCRQQQRDYLASTLQILEEVIDLEDWRNTTLSGILSQWATLAAERWRMTVKTLGGFHRFIDPESYIQLKQKVKPMVSTCKQTALYRLLEPSDDGLQGGHLLHELASVNLPPNSARAARSDLVHLPQFPVPAVIQTHNRNSTEDEVGQQSMENSVERTTVVGTPIERMTMASTLPTHVKDSHGEPCSPRWVLQGGHAILSPSDHHQHHLESLSGIDFGTLPPESKTSAETVTFTDTTTNDGDATPTNAGLRGDPPTPPAPLNCRSVRSLNSSSTRRSGTIPFFTPTSRETPSTVATAAELETPSTLKTPTASTSKTTAKLTKRLSWSQKLDDRELTSNDHDQEGVHHEGQYEAINARRGRTTTDEDNHDFDLEYTSASQPNDQDHERRARLEARRKNISELLSWLSQLPSVRDDTTPYPLRPPVAVPLVNQVTAMVSVPLSLSLTSSPILQCKAWRFNGSGRLTAGILEGGSMADLDQWQKVHVVITPHYYVHVFDENENTKEECPLLWSSQLKHLEITTGRGSKSSPERLLQFKERSDHHSGTPSSVAHRFVLAVSRMALGRSRSCLLNMPSEDELLRWTSTLACIIPGLNPHTTTTPTSSLVAVTPSLNNPPNVSSSENSVTDEELQNPSSIHSDETSTAMHHTIADDQQDPSNVPNSSILAPRLLSPSTTAVQSSSLHYSTIPLEHNTTTTTTPSPTSLSPPVQSSPSATPTSTGRHKESNGGFKTFLRYFSAKSSSP